jgi:hypothetical protein
MLTRANITIMESITFIKYNSVNEMWLLRASNAIHETANIKNTSQRYDVNSPCSSF